MRAFKLALALVSISYASAALAQSTFEVPAGTGERFQGVVLIDPTTGKPAGAVYPPSAISGKIVSTITPLPANTSTQIVGADAARYAYSIQCAVVASGATAATVISENGVVLTSAAFGTPGQTAFLPASTTAALYTPPAATQTAITAYSATAQTCVVTSYDR